LPSRLLKEEKPLMLSNNRRAAARRRAWGRGPIILRFEPLEGRQLLAANPLPDLVGAALSTSVQTLDWGDTFHATGVVKNQGNGAESGPISVALYASTNPVLGPGSVLLAATNIPGDLKPGDISNFDQVVSLPPTPIPGFSGQPIYITLRVDPQNTIPEANDNNNFGVGQGFDTSKVTIAQALPSSLLGTSLGVYPDQTNWGQPVSVTTQVRNNGSGDAPPTRAQVILTPTGTNPGSGADVTIGYLDVPAIPAFQTVNVVGTVTLPAGPPTVLQGSTQFYLSVLQDADYITNPLFPHVPTQGLGIDTVQLGIAAGTTANLPQGPKADLAATGVIAPTQAIAWGQSFQLTTTVQNVGRADAGPFDVKFILTGASGSLDHSIYLGKASIDGLKAGFDQQIIQTLKLPNRLPPGITLDSVGIGRIAVLIDQDQVVDEALKTNNISQSNPVTLRVLGTDGRSTVPTAPAGTSLGQPQPAGAISQSATPTKAQERALARAQARQQARANGKLHRRPVPKKQSLTDKIEHNLKVFPDKVSSFVKDLFH
jgi:hypothetical protein